MLRDLAALNTSLPGAWLAADRETIELTRNSRVWLDVEQFRQRMDTCQTHPHPAGETCADCLPLLHEAVALYSHHFLAGFTLRDCPEFDDWQFFPAEGLQQELATTLERLVQGHGAQGEYEVGIPYARRWVALDPLNEPAQRKLMRLYALAGRRHEALRQYQTCSEVLAAELDATPAPETEVLYQQIVSGDLNPPPVSTPKPAWLAPAPIAVEVERSAPLAGRETELETLQAKVGAGWSGQGIALFLAGVSGVGKTRLAYETLRAAVQSGVTTLVGAAYEQEGHLAYHPFIEAIDRYLAEQQRPPKENPITHYKPMGSGDPKQETSALFRPSIGRKPKRLGRSLLTCSSILAPAAARPSLANGWGFCKQRKAAWTKPFPPWKPGWWRPNKRC